jgi:DNA-binding response OmpR family regulator
MHALIIEDEPIVAINIEIALRDCGCTSCDVACSFDEAVEAAMQRCPDLITADVQLSPGSGVDAVATICGRKCIPVIFITGTPAEAQRRFPSCPIIQKPFVTAQIIAARTAVDVPADSCCLRRGPERSLHSDDANVRFGWKTDTRLSQTVDDNRQAGRRTAA